MTTQSANLTAAETVLGLWDPNITQELRDLLSGCLGGVIYTRLLKVRSEDLNPGTFRELIGDSGPRTSHQLDYVRIAR